MTLPERYGTCQCLVAVGVVKIVGGSRDFVRQQSDVQKRASSATVQSGMIK